MTIVVAGAHKAAAAGGARAHAAANAAPDDASSGDSFMAMLAALDIDATTAPAGDAAAGLTVPDDNGSPTRGRAGKPLREPPDPLPQDMSAANAALMLQTALPARDAAPAASAAESDGATTDADAALAGVAGLSGVSGAARIVAGTDAAAPATTAASGLAAGGALPGARAVAVPDSPGAANALPGADATAPGAPATATRPVLPVPADASGTAAWRTLPIAGAPVRPEAGPVAGMAELAGAQRAASTDAPATPAVRPDARLQKLEALQAASQQVPGTTARAGAATPADSPVLLTMAGQDLLAQRPERERPAGALHTADADAGWKGLTTSTPPLLAPVDAAGASAPGTHANLAERMVEQVSWWLSQKTQGAELTLNMPGGAPVSVSVQVQGNEAQVVFRSDHADARQLLGDALPQLKEMFGSEGLMLTGASVGSSAGDTGGDAAARQPSQAANGRAAPAIEPPAAVEPVRRQAAGRLDLYV